MDASGSFGVYRGVVADNRDPLGKGRLRLKVPQLMQDKVTDWAWPIEVFGIATSMPKVGQGVWVMFEGGDPSWPLWAGVFGKNIGNTNDYMFSSIASLSAFSDITAYIKTTTAPDGTRSVDILATLLAIGATLKNHEQRITAEENKPDLT